MWVHTKTLSVTFVLNHRAKMFVSILIYWPLLFLLLTFHLYSIIVLRSRSDDNAMRTLDRLIKGESSWGPLQWKSMGLKNGLLDHNGFKTNNVQDKKAEGSAWTLNSRLLQLCLWHTERKTCRYWGTVCVCVCVCMCVCVCGVSGKCILLILWVKTLNLHILFYDAFFKMHRKVHTWPV